jgi:tetratricopeptide (TPR) repeat protein
MVMKTASHNLAPPSKKLYKILILIGILTSIITGFIFFQLINIPFGFKFNLTLYLFGASLSILLLSSSVLCFYSSRIWLKIIGIIPILLSVIIIGLTIIIKTDYRILYYKSFAPKPTKAEWIEDVRFLKNQMVEKHSDISAMISVEELNDTVKEIEKRIPNLSDSEILMELFKLSSMPNDAHTFPFRMFPCFDLNTFPIQVYDFKEGWIIIDAGREYKDLIGSKIIKIGSEYIEDIYKTYPLFLAAESEYAYKARFPYMCFMADWLAYHQIIENIDKADFTLMKPSGEEFEVSIPTLKFYPHFLWSSIATVENSTNPAFINPREDNYKFELNKETGTLYVQFNLCENQEGKETLDEFTKRLEKFVNNMNFERFVVDIRNNDGGNRVWSNFAKFICDNDKINKQGKLFVLIGRRTFSSAVLFANQLQMQTNAVFVGEPTSQGPQFYGGPKFIELPNSKLVFMVSSHLAISGFPFDKRKSIIPDIFIENSYEDLITGKDRALDTIRHLTIPEKYSKPIPVNELMKFTGRYLYNPFEALDVYLKDSALYLSYSDFIPEGLKRFNSKLFPISEHIFETKIPDMNINFSDIKSSVSKKLILTWQGDTVAFNRTKEDYTISMELFSEGKIEAGCEVIYNNKDNHIKHINGLENMLNAMGYNYLNKNDVKNALHIFKLNTKLFPESSNTYDSYGEALLKNGNSEEAIKNYKKSIELNPDNQNGIKALEELGVKI